MSNELHVNVTWTGSCFVGTSPELPTQIVTLSLSGIQTEDRGPHAPRSG